METIAAAPAGGLFNFSFESQRTPMKLDDDFEDDEGMALKLLGSALLDDVMADESEMPKSSNSESQTTSFEPDQESCDPSKGDDADRGFPWLAFSGRSISDDIARSSHAFPPADDTCDPPKAGGGGGDEDRSRGHPWGVWGEFNGPSDSWTLGPHSLAFPPQFGGPGGPLCGEPMTMEQKLYHNMALNGVFPPYVPAFGAHSPHSMGMQGTYMMRGHDGMDDADMNDMQDAEDGLTRQAKKRSRRRRANKRKKEDTYVRSAPSHDECVIVPVEWCSKEGKDDTAA